MDERWLLDLLDPPLTAAELLVFGDRTTRTGGHVVWTGPVQDGEGVAPFRGDLLTAQRLAFAATWGGLPKPPYRVGSSCGDRLCVSPADLTVVAPRDARG